MRRHFNALGELRAQPHWMPMRHLPTTVRIRAQFQLGYEMGPLPCAHLDSNPTSLQQEDRADDNHQEEEQDRGRHKSPLR